MKLGLILVMLMSSLFARELKVGYGLTLAPYIFAKENKGIEYDIIKKTLEKAGHTVTPVYYNPTRLASALKENKIDLMGNASESNPAISFANFSVNHVDYQNVAVTLKSQGLSVGSIADLKKYSVVAFVDATKYLGDDYNKAMSSHSNYHEFPDQTRQVNSLFSKQSQVLVMDINIFRHIRAQIGDAAKEEVMIHEIFPVTKYKVAFADAALRDEFNEAFNEMKSSGEIEKIISTYVTK